MEFRYWKSCPELTRDEVDIQTRMIDEAREVTYRTFRRQVGVDELDRWSKEHGYVLSRRHGHGATLKHDPYVAFYRSNWGGRPCYYLVWSAMEFIWLGPVQE